MCFSIHAIFIQTASKYLFMIIYYNYKWLLCSGTILSTSKSQWIRKKMLLLGVPRWLSLLSAHL